MIRLFHIPQYTISTHKFSNLLHDKRVQQFEETFAEYVGAKYCVTMNSATNAIQFILGKFFTEELGEKVKLVKIPNNIPIVVVNAAINAGNKIWFTDEHDWVGNRYILHKFQQFSLIDSAQEVERGFGRVLEDNLVIYSHFPTKPIGSCDGCSVMSDDFTKIDLLRKLVNNGTVGQNSSCAKVLFPGQKAYMNSIQADIAMKNLIRLDEKKDRLTEIRSLYYREFLNSPVQILNYGTSYHLFRIGCSNRTEFMENMKKEGIETGVHYRPLYGELSENPHYKPHLKKMFTEFSKTTYDGTRCVSLPFHEKLSNDNVKKVTALTLKFAKY